MTAPQPGDTRMHLSNGESIVMAGALEEWMKHVRASARWLSAHKDGVAHTVINRDQIVWMERVQ
jgi:hypothetical protein